MLRIYFHFNKIQTTERNDVRNEQPRNICNVGKPKHKKPLTNYRELNCKQLVAHIWSVVNVVSLLSMACACLVMCHAMSGGDILLEEREGMPPCCRVDSIGRRCSLVEGLEKRGRTNQTFFWRSSCWASSIFAVLLHFVCCAVAFDTINHNTHKPQVGGGR